MAKITGPENKNVKITLLNRVTGGQYTIPVLPTNGEIAYDDGDQQPIALNIVGLGEVKIPDGVMLDSVTWDSFFPARHDPFYCSVPAEKLKAPETYRNNISSWKDDGVPVQFICVAAGVNKTMFIQSFKWAYRGFEGDLYYTITLTEYKPITPRKVTPDGQPIKKGAGAESRPAQAAPAKKAKTYTVKAGDTLTAIAKKVGIPVNTLAANNKAIIPNPNKISPGQVLTL